MFRITSLLSSAVLVLAVSTPAIGMSAKDGTVSPEEATSNQSNYFQTSFLKRQVDQNMSVGRAISSIASHYPQDVVSIVDIALDTYPDQYREIIFAAISSQPSSTEEIVQLAIEKEVSSCPNIVQLAIMAEPTYVDFVVHAAAVATPEERQKPASFK